MSMMRCDGCGFVVDTDSDPDALYVDNNDCLCEACREGVELCNAVHANSVSKAIFGETR